jgi:hypothetical protein
VKPQTWPALRVEFPHTPSHVLSPNKRAHRLARRDGRELSFADAARLIRSSAFNATVSQINARPWAPPHLGRLRLEFFVYWERGRYTAAGHNFPDDDNLIAMLKPARDGIAQALRIDDRLFKTAGVEQDHDPDGAGCVVALITPMEP